MLQRDGEIIAAEFTTGKHPRLTINRIFAGRRERVAEYVVSGKREARALAATLNAQPWNF